MRVSVGMCTRRRLTYSNWTYYVLFSFLVFFFSSSFLFSLNIQQWARIPMPSHSTCHCCCCCSLLSTSRAFCAFFLLCNAIFFSIRRRSVNNNSTRRNNESQVCPQYPCGICNMHHAVSANAICLASLVYAPSVLRKPLPAATTTMTMMAKIGTKSEAASSSSSCSSQWRNFFFSLFLLSIELNRNAMCGCGCEWATVSSSGSNERKKKFCRMNEKWKSLHMFAPPYSRIVWMENVWKRKRQKKIFLLSPSLSLSTRSGETASRWFFRVLTYAHTHTTDIICSPLSSWNSHPDWFGAANRNAISAYVRQFCT